MTRRQRKLADAQDGVQRQEVEQKEEDRWCKELAEELVASNFPIVQLLSAAQRPEVALQRQGGVIGPEL